MLQAGSGIYWVPVLALGRLVASSVSFQALCGVASEDLAMARLHAPVSFDRSGVADPRPRGVIDWAHSENRVKGSQQRSANGALWLSIEATIPQQYQSDEKLAHCWFCQQISLIAQEMFANSGQFNFSGQPYLNMAAMIFDQPPAMGIPDNEAGELFYGVIWQVEFIG
jgi:hypothetical protein